MDALSELKQLAEEKRILEKQIQASRAEQKAAYLKMRVARTHESRLLQQMALLHLRADKAIAVEERQILELEQAERAAQRSQPSAFS
jgi:hypothetical protein